MSSFLDRLLGRRKATSAVLSGELEKAESALRAAPERTALAEAVLRNVADLSDAEHEGAEIELAAAQRSEVRLAAQVEQLQSALKHAEKTEAAAALKAHAEAASRSVEEAVPVLLREYEDAAARVASIAGKLAEIENEVRVVNFCIREAQKKDPVGVHPKRVLHTSERWLTEPAIVEPDTVVSEDVWEVPTVDGCGWQPANVYEARNGKTVPVDPAARLIKRQRTIPGRTRKASSIPSPIANLVLPSARLDAWPFWPKVG